MRKRPPETAPRLDRRTDDDELSPVLGRDAGDFLAGEPRPCSNDLTPDADPVRRGDRRRGIEPLAELSQVEARIERQLALDDERRDEDDSRPAVGGETAREVEGVLGLLPLEQRHDDRPVGDRPRPPRQPARAAVDEPEIEARSHRMTW